MQIQNQRDQTFNELSFFYQQSDQDNNESVRDNSNNNNDTNTALDRNCNSLISNKNATTSGSRAYFNYNGLDQKQPRSPNSKPTKRGQIIDENYSS